VVVRNHYCGWRLFIKDLANADRSGTNSLF
jgi:hypothetical protein